jgi:hypothetical protein
MTLFHAPISLAEYTLPQASRDPLRTAASIPPEIKMGQKGKWAKPLVRMEE